MGIVGCGDVADRRYFATEDLADRRARHAENGSEPVGPDPQRHPRLDHSLNDVGGQGARGPTRGGAAVLQARQAVSAISADPLRGRLTTHASHLGRLGHRPSLELDALGQERSAEYRQLRPTMSHESLPTVWITNNPNRGQGLSLVNNAAVNHS